jgi:O-glycosyl hydrolase
MRNNRRAFEGPLSFAVTVPAAAILLLASSLVTVPLVSAVPRASAASSGAGVTAVVNGRRTFQTMAGFGASEAFGQARVIMKASPDVQRRILRLLYSKTRGAGLTILRNEISADPGITIEPNAPASPSAAPSYARLGTDQGQEWLAARIRAEYGVTDVIADAWSAPAFMKTNGSTTGGGTLCGVPGGGCASGDWRQAYAHYLVRYAEDYAADGVPLTYLDPVNEPDYAAPDYDGMVMSPGQVTNFLAVLGPVLKASRLRTKVECCDAGTWPLAAQYAGAIEADPAASAATSVYTSHGYWVPVDYRMPGWRGPVWETEWAPLAYKAWDQSWDDGSPASGLTWAQMIYSGLTKAWLSSVLYWWGTETPKENGDNEALILVNGSTVTPSGRLWAYACFSRYIRPGAVRIAVSSPSGSGGSGSGLELTAFRNTDGGLAIVAINPASTARRITFVLSRTGSPNGAMVTPHLSNATHLVAATQVTFLRRNSFTATIPGRSVVTYVIAHPRHR